MFRVSTISLWLRCIRGKYADGPYRRRRRRRRRRKRRRYLSGPPLKEPSLQAPSWPVRERSPVPRALLIHHSNSPVYEPPPDARFPSDIKEP
jgi:hypothetical protein